MSLTGTQVKRELTLILEGLVSDKNVRDNGTLSSGRLISNGMLSSLEVIEFVLQVEMHFGIEFSDNELSLDSFDSLDRLAAAIERKLGMSQNKIPNHRHVGPPLLSSPHEVHERLRATGELIEFDSGHLGYAGRLWRLIQALDRRFSRMAAALSAQELALPGTMSLAATQRSGYLSRFPQHACFAVNLIPNTNSLNAVSEAVAEPEFALIDTICPAMDPPGRMVRPLLCFSIYEHLAGRHLTDAGARTYTTSGRCMRHEQDLLPGLARLTEFTMREVVFVGSQDAVAEGCERLVDDTRAVAAEWGLTFTVAVATDPFFRAEDVQVGVLQRLAGLKRELRAELGQPDNSLAVSSFNMHGDLFGRRYGITGESGPVSTACVGWGLERWALAILCQQGPDFSSLSLIDD